MCIRDRCSITIFIATYDLPADAEKGLSPNNESYAPTLNLMMFATNYNVLRVMSGMGGLAYSN